MSAAEQESGEDVGSCFDQIKNFVTASKLNVLYVFVPISIVLGNTNLNPTLTFVCAFFGLIPLAQALGDLTEDIAKRTNAATAALINVTFGNATEVIVSITALRLGQLDIIRYSLVGSVIGNMLLVAGSALVVAGVKYPIMEFNVHATNSFVTMLILSSFCYVLPSTFNTIATQNTVDPSLTLSFSRQISVVMIVLYAAYMYFQHRSHAHLFDGSAEEEEEALDVPSPAGETNAAGDVEMTAVAAPAASESIEHSKSAVVPTATLPPTVAVSRSAVVEPPPAVVTVDIGEGDDDDDDDDDPEYSFLFAVVMTGVVAVLISILSDYLVASLDDAAQSLKLSRHFVGLVIVAIVGNVAEHAGAIMMAYRNKMDIALSIALGSSVQIGMFVMPLICVFGIFFDQPLDLAVTPFLIASVFASVVLLLSVINLGCATWLGGMQLLAAWLLFALAYINAPD